MTAARVRPEIEVGPIRPPQRLAPYSHAVGAEVLHPDSDVVAEQSEGDAFGRLILLFDPDGDEAWNGTMRLVAYIQADLDEAVAADPLLPEVGWNWLLDSLSTTGAQFNAPSGTVTRVSSASFGKLSPRNDDSEIEIRASWSPVINSPSDIFAHVQAWCNLMTEVAGLAPIPDGVASISSARRRG